jgi:hypothetical protein
MAAKVKLEEGQSFIRGRSSAKAKELIERLGDGEGSIITTAFGYIVPSSIVKDDEADTEYANVLPDGTDVAKAERGEESEDESTGDESTGDESEEPKAERKSRSRKAADTEEGK